MDLKQFENLKITSRKYCVVCGGKTDKVINLPEFPLTEFYVKKKPVKRLGFADQALMYCQNCGHGQLLVSVDPEVIYGSSYITRTSTSASAIWALEVFSEFAERTLKGRKVKTVFEIGCNDLFLLRKFKSRAEVLFGVDPVLKGMEKEIKDRKIRVIGDFFENIDVKEVAGGMDVVFSSHTLEHIEDPKKLFSKILEAGHEKTVYCFQFPGFEQLVSDAHFDQVFHQHLNYFTLSSVEQLLSETGGELLDWGVNPYHWGALMVAFRKKSKQPKRNDKRIRKEITPEYIKKQYGLFLAGIESTRKKIDSYNDRIIYGYGAAQMLPVLEYHLKRIGNLKNIIDDDIRKKDMYYLNLPVQIKHPSQVRDLEESVILVTAINSLQTVRSVVSRLIEKRAERIIIPGGVI